MSFMEKLFGTFSDKELKRIKPLADKVLALEPEMQKLTDAELQAKTPALKEKTEEWRHSGRDPARSLRRLP